MLVKDRMSRQPITVGPDDTLAHALRLTRKHRIRHLPVVGSDQLLAGIVSDRDIRLAMPSPLTVPDAERADFLERTPVAAVMSRTVITVAPEETIENAARQLYKHRIGSVPVVDGEGHLHGILSETDILHVFVEILGGAEPSSRIEVALADRPGQLAAAIRVVGEEHRVNIVSIMVPAVRGEARKRAVLHVDTIDPGHLVEALEAAGFEAGSPSLESDLRSRRGDVEG
jgi:acetoin utilization protein AcuB